MIMEALTAAKAQALPGLLGVLLVAAVAALNTDFITASEKIEAVNSKLDDHVLDYTKLEASVTAVGKDVAYNRERGDLIQTQNTSAHSRQEKKLEALDEKIDLILHHLTKDPR